MPRLSDLTLKNLVPPQQGRIMLWDDGSPLGVRMTANGTKTFIVMLGSGRRHTIGKYGDITLAQARLAAQTLKAEKTLGRLLPRSVSLQDARTGYLAQLDISASTKSYYTRHLSRLKAKNLTDITPQDVNHLLDSLDPQSANQCLASFRAFFNWCIRRHYVEKSPCQLMRMPNASTSRARVLTDAEVKSVWRACEQTGEQFPGVAKDQGEAEMPPRLPAHFATIVRLLILTGQRRGEIAALQSSWINLNSSKASEQSSSFSLLSSPNSSIDLCTITLPATITKNGRSHTFPFGELASMFITHGKCTDTGLLFPARGKNTPFAGWSKSKAALDEISGVTGWTLHDLRRGFASRLASLGCPIHIIERLLNHVSGQISGVVAVYNRHSYAAECRLWINKYEEHLKSVLQLTD